MQLPPEPDEPRNRPERDDLPIDGGAIAETGGHCCLGALLPGVAVVFLLVVLALRI
jgi:hypothetical protein